MRRLRNLLLVAGCLLLLAVGGAALYLRGSGPALSVQTQAEIDAVLAAPLPELVRGDTGVASSQGLAIWYERIEPAAPSKGTVLLVMGISNDALGWPRRFVDALVDAGYRVVRYDHRGTGLSDWDTPDGRAYSLADMAGDGRAVLDALQQPQAHVVGVSMGGMIAQQFAIAYPERTRSLTSIMSSAHIEDQTLPPISSQVAYELIKVALKYGIPGGEANHVRLHIASRMILMGDAGYTPNVREVAQSVLYNLRRRRGYNAAASRAHQAAVHSSGARYDELAALRTPTLVIHGRSDPFIPIEHGIKSALSIPGAQALWVDGMGHDIPDHLVGTLVEAMLANFEREHPVPGTPLPPGAQTPRQ